MSKKATKKAEAKTPVKRVVIFRDYTEEDGDCFAYRKGATTVTGFRRPFTAIRGVLADLKVVTKPSGYTFNFMDRRLDLNWFTPSGQLVKIVRDYIEPAKKKK